MYIIGSHQGWAKLYQKLIMVEQKLLATKAPHQTNHSFFLCRSFGLSSIGQYCLCSLLLSPQRAAGLAVLFISRHVTLHSALLEAFVVANHLGFACTSIHFCFHTRIIPSPYHRQALPSSTLVLFDTCSACAGSRWRMWSKVAPSADDIQGHCLPPFRYALNAFVFVHVLIAVCVCSPLQQAASSQSFEPPECTETHEAPQQQLHHCLVWFSSRNFWKFQHFVWFFKKKFHV